MIEFVSGVLFGAGVACGAAALFIVILMIFSFLDYLLRRHDKEIWARLRQEKAGDD